MSNRSTVIVSTLVPKTELRAARLALGWSLADAAHELIKMAASQGHVLPEPDSVRRQLIRWESGKVAPSEFYRSLLLPLLLIEPDALPRTRVTLPESEPRTPLHAARLQAGRSLTDVARELTKVATNRGKALPNLTTLRRQVIRWESGKVAPSEFYAPLLCALYRASLQELGLAPEVLVMPPATQRLPAHPIRNRTRQHPAGRLRYHACRR